MKTEYDDAKHEYRINGKKALSVTTVLKLAGIAKESAYYSPAHAERGSFVHETCELYDKGILDESSLDPRLAGYLEGWKKFRQYMPVRFTGIERACWSEEHMLAGRIDRDWLDGIGDGVVCDIKTGAFPDWLALQLAGYSILHPAKYGVGVRLTSEGKFSMKNIGCYELGLARKAFLCALKKARDEYDR